MKPHRVRGYVAGRGGKPTKVSGYMRGVGKPGGGGPKGAARKATSKATRKGSATRKAAAQTSKRDPSVIGVTKGGSRVYNPKTGPSEAEIRRNAEVMYGTAAARKMLAARDKKKKAKKR